MKKSRIFNLLVTALAVFSLLFGGSGMSLSSAEAKELQPQSDAKGKLPPTPKPAASQFVKRITPQERQAAADRLTSMGILPGLARKQNSRLDQAGALRDSNAPMLDPNVLPHYFGPFANYANSPMPKGPITSVALDAGGSGYTAPTVSILDVYGTGYGAVATATVSGGVITAIQLVDGGADYSAPMVLIEDATGSGAAATPNIGGSPASLTGGIRKFVDSLPLLGPGGANNLGNYLTVATPDTTTFPGSDYYEIELSEYTQQLHSDLPPTTLRGYRQTNMGGTPFSYLGPTIIAQRDRPVRVKFTNSLPTGADGNLFIPVDTTVMGAGEGPVPGENYTENRATLHLHGGLSPWISDGTPHQWITPAGETTSYPKGVSVVYVPDMWYDAGGNVVAAGTPGASNNPGDGAMTFFYSNQQSARLMFYHDHTYGITRLNVYAGEAGAYLILDQVEKDLIDGTNITGVNPGLQKILPDTGIPLIFQDKTFVDATTIGAQDPTWRWGTGPIDPATGRREPKTGDLWTSSVYMPAQNPWDPTGASAFGRWMYGPWFNPPTVNITYPPTGNPYYDPGCDPAVGFCEPPSQPALPNPSMGMEAFNDTAMVNGAIYPYMEVEPKEYRFRVLNAANDRFVNLQMYVADSSVVTSDGRINTEVRMVPANIPGWSEDNRVGGVPDPNTAGPAWIQIGTEGGFLPSPVLVPNQPINWNMNPTAFNVGNVTDHALLLAPAERADVIVDFSQYAGQTIIVYNDAPTAFPALDPRYDYYTGNPNQMDTGGTPTTQPGFGPNTRTFMQIRVAGTPSGTPPTNAYNPATLAKLQYAFTATASKPSVFQASFPGEDIIVPQAAYNSAYNQTFPADTASQYAQISEYSKTFTPLGSTSPITINFEPKAIHDEMGGVYDVDYGRMSGNLGVDIPGTNALNQNLVLSGYASPPVDILQNSMTPLGTAKDGTQIWRIMHNGVDTHPIHFHLFNVQVINRVAWDGALLPPDPTELGWKETVRVNPLEDTIVAMRPFAPVLPFEVPNSIRPIDVTKPLGAPLMGGPNGFQDPLANPVTVVNHMVNFGWEYVYHCHILSHEEMDMMHAMGFAVEPDAPSNLILTPAGASMTLQWLDNSVNETEFTVQRSSNGAAWTNIVVPSATGPNTGDTISYVDTVTPGNTYLYRVLATNVVGDRFDYGPGTIGFPTITLHSPASNTVASAMAVSSILRASANPTSASSVDFTVTFSEAVTGVDTGDFALAATGSLTGAGITDLTGSGDSYVVTVNTGSGSGTLRLDLLDNDTIVGVLSGPLGGAGAGNGDFTTGESYTVDRTPPAVASIVRASANPSKASGVSFTVTFDVPVTGVDVADFSLTTTGLAGSAVSAVSGSGSVYTVTVLSGTGNAGTLRLDVNDNDSILGATGVPLGGAGLGNGNFTTGEVYAIDNVAPTVVSSVRASANPANASSTVNFTVTFSEAVTGVDKTDFSLAVSGLSGASVASVSGTGATRTVTVNTGVGNGTLRLNVLDNNTIIDALGNPLGGAGITPYVAGQSYIVGVPPSVASIVSANPNPTGLATVNYTVTFTQSVTGVDVGDFALTTTGVTGASIVSVSGSGATRTVSVNTGAGNGTIRLDLIDNDSIVNSGGFMLGGTGMGNGNLNGQVYTIDKTVPVVTSISRGSASPTSSTTVTYYVYFSEAVTGVDASDFIFTTSGVSGASVAGITGTGAYRIVTVNTGTGSGTLRMDVADDNSIIDVAGNALGGPGVGDGNFTTGQAYTIDKTPLAVTSIVRGSANPTSASSVTFYVYFNRNVTGVDAADFVLTAPGLSGVSVTGISGSGTYRIVTVNTGTGSGTLRLDVTDNDSIVDTTGGLPLGGVGIGNGDFTGGQVYTIDKTPLVVTSIVRGSANPTSASSVTFYVYFNRNVTGVDAADFVLTAPGLSGASVTGISGSGYYRIVTINTGTGSGTLRLDVTDNDSIVDTTGGLPLGDAGIGNGDFTGGQVYTIDKTPLAVTSIVRGSANPTSASSVTFYVYFNRNVTGVDATDFVLTAPGLSGVSVTGISGSGTYRIVTVNTGTGSGTLRLDVTDNDSIVDTTGGLPLGGPGLLNGDFTAGQFYTVR